MSVSIGVWYWWCHECVKSSVVWWCHECVKSSVVLVVS